MSTTAIAQASIFPPMGGFEPPKGGFEMPSTKTLLLIGAGVAVVAATGGVAAGVMLSGGSWAVFGTAVGIKLKAGGIILGKAAVKGAAKGATHAIIAHMKSNDRG